MKTVFPSGWSGAHRSNRVGQPRRSPQDECRPHGSPASCTDAGEVYHVGYEGFKSAFGGRRRQKNKCIGQHAVQILYKIYYVYMEHMEEHLRAGQNKIRTCEKYSSARWTAIYSVVL